MSSAVKQPSPGESPIHRASQERLDEHQAAGAIERPADANRPDDPRSVESTLRLAREKLLSLQYPDGHWCGELQGDTILESEYVLLMAFLGRENEEKVCKAAAYIWTQERPEGAWSCYPGGPADLTVSVKAYFALKITGVSESDPRMVRARNIIRDLGGAENSNSFTKFYLALLGQFPYENCAAVPPEMMFLPRRAYFSIYAMSSWTRTIVVPLSIFFAHKPVRTLPTDKGIRELFVTDPMKPRWPCPPAKRLVSWTNAFLVLDKAIKLFERWGPKWIRQRAVKKAARWMMDHFTDSDGVGAIYPPIIYTIICLRCLGYADDSDEMKWALKQLDDLMIEERTTLRIQPCFSPVWDTAITVNALAMTGMRANEAEVERGCKWLIDREVRRPGDWSLMNPGLEPSGWFFEYRNGFYPDIDDTSMVLMGLARSGYAFVENPPTRRREEEPTGDPNASLAELHASWSQRERTPIRAAAEVAPATPAQRPKPRLIPAVVRGVRWMLAMQNCDGGWAAFDRDINHEILTKVPFADHNAMLDPSCSDITGRVLEALGQLGYGVDHPSVASALAFLERTQDPRGCWLGRWGVNYIYGSWQVLVGLEAVGVDPAHPMIRKAVRWLQDVQQASGAWGESCRSYDDPATAGQGEATPSQTAWAVLGLISAGEGSCEAVRRGIAWLIENQEVDGDWTEEQFTGTGFPRVFYLRYHLYRLYFPLMALARYRDCQRAAGDSVVGESRVAEYRWTPV